MVRKVEVERFSVRSSKSFETVLAALKAGVGRLDLVEFAKTSKSTSSFSELENLIGRYLGSTGLMLFMELDHGAVLRKETKLDKPKMVRFVIGNPLIMKEMAKHVPDAGSYAPVTVLIDERDDGVHLSYDRMASLLAPYGNADASAVARDLDVKVENLLREPGLTQIAQGGSEQRTCPCGAYKEMIRMTSVSNITVPTQFIETRLEKYAYRRFGSGPGLPLLCLQHFTGTLDNWDPAVTDALALGREVILFESAGLGRSTGEVPASISGMAAHAIAFMDTLGLERVDLLGFSLGGMVAQQIALERPTFVRKMLLVATAPEGGEDIMHMEKPELKKITDDPNLSGLERLVKLFFAPSESSQLAGKAFAARLAARKEDREPLASPEVAMAQIRAFRAWEQSNGDRFNKLGKITQPCLVVNGVFDDMIPVRNSYMLSENLPNAMLLTYPDAGHGSLFQFHSSFVKQASQFLDSDSIS